MTNSDGWKEIPPSEIQLARAVVLLPEHQIDEQQEHAADGGQIAEFLRAGQVAQRPADDQIDHNTADQADELLCEIGGIIRGDDGKAERAEEKASVSTSVGRCGASCAARQTAATP